MFSGLVPCLSSNASPLGFWVTLELLVKLQHITVLPLGAPAFDGSQNLDNHRLLGLSVDARKEHHMRATHPILESLVTVNASSP